MKALWGFITRIASGIGRTLGDALSNLTKKLQNADFDQFLAFINTLSIGGIALGIRKFLKDLSGGISGLLSGIGNFKKIVKGVVSVLDGVRGCLDAYQTQLKADVLMKLAIAIGILAASLVVLSLIDSE